MLRRTTLYLSIIALLPVLTHFLGNYVRAVLETFGGATALSILWVPPLVVYGSFFGMMLFYLRTTFEPLSTYGWRWNTQYLGLAIGIGLASGIGMYLLDGRPTAAELSLPLATAGAVLGTIVARAVLPALFEETLFRGVMQRFYQSATERTIAIGSVSVPCAVFIASGMEVLFHAVFPLYANVGNPALGSVLLSTLPQLGYVAVFGAIGGYLYYRTQSLVAPVVIHLLGNTTEFMLVWLFS